MRPSSNQKERKSKIPYLFILGGALVLALGAGLLLRRPTPASATPSFLTLAEAQYPFIVGSRIDTCNLCHVPNAIPSLNAYGTDFLNHGLNAAALTAIENLDSDSDGFTNIQELRALTFPGDPTDHPQAASATPTATSPSIPTTAPSNTPTTVPTAVPSNTPTSVPTNAPSNTPTTIPTPGPTATVVPTATASLTALPSATESPTEAATETITPVPTGTVVANPAASCQEAGERSEHFKKSHGKSAEQLAAAEEAAEEEMCEKQEKETNEANDVEEAHESSQAELHEHEKQGGEVNGGQQEGSDQQESSGQQGNEDQQGNLVKDQSFTSSIDLWLSKFNIIYAGFHE